MATSRAVLIPPPGPSDDDFLERVASESVGLSVGGTGFPAAGIDRLLMATNATGWGVAEVPLGTSGRGLYMLSFWDFDTAPSQRRTATLGVTGLSGFSDGQEDRIDLGQGQVDARRGRRLSTG